MWALIISNFDIFNKKDVRLFSTEEEAMSEMEEEFLYICNCYHRKGSLYESKSGINKRKRYAKVWEITWYGVKCVELNVARVRDERKDD